MPRTRPFGPDDPGHVERDMPAAAADVEHPVAALEPRVLEEPQGCRRA